MQASHSPAPPPPPVSQSGGPYGRYPPGQALYPGGLPPPPTSGGLTLPPPPPPLPLSASSRPHSTSLRPPSAGIPPNSATSSFYPPAPPISTLRRKRLIVACDGTWLDSDNGLSHSQMQIPSNVTRISRAIKAESSDNVSQIVFYQGGVGTEGGIISRVVGGATAEGLSSNIREGYSFIANNYAPGDEIFLLGFSRGAFTARSIAGIIGAVGLLTKSGLSSLGVIFKDVQNQQNKSYDSPFPNIPFPNKPSASDPSYSLELQRRGLSRLNVPIKAVAVWDTVGSLGIPRVPFLERLGLQRKTVKEYTFYDTSLSDAIENAFQALALDEHRASFSPTVWEKTSRNRTNLRQVWFPGVHSNVGGGYEDQEISNITLAWMIAQLEPFLDFNRDYIVQQYESNISLYEQTGQEPRPWSFGEIYRSMTGIYAYAGKAIRTPGSYTRMDPATGSPTRKALRNTNEYIHPSVRSRIYLDGPGIEDRGLYSCRAMDEYKLRLTGSRPEDNRPIAVWESRAKRKGLPRKTLPESPLWETELKLLRYSQRVEEFLFEEQRNRRRRGMTGGRATTRLSP